MNTSKPRINILSINGGYIKAEIGFNSVNDTYHIWLISCINSCETFLSCGYDNSSFDEQVNRWIKDWHSLNPKRINFDSFEDLILKHKL